MPELPDILTYLDALRARIVGQHLEHVRLKSPFVLRSVDPPLASVSGSTVTGVDRIGKRIVLELEGDLFLVVHLMIAGRLRWREPGTTLSGKAALAAFDFSTGTLVLTEAGTKRRAALHVVRGREALRPFDRGGLDVMTADLAAFGERLRSESHTLKRALTDPRLLDGIGNAYSDEILHRARLSPVTLTGSLTQEEVERLYQATRHVLDEWTDRLRQDTGSDFPEKVTAFREGMAVHGRYGQPCPACGTAVQRIRYAERETNYCPRCQTGGRLLRDRSLSRLLKRDWPKTIEEIE